MNNRRLLVVEGNIGAGKTTLARKLAQKTDARLVLERFEDNPFLPKFYEDKSRYAFPVELSFLADRYHQLVNEVDKPDLFQQLTVCDYHFFKSLVFARQTLSDDEYLLYSRLFHIIMSIAPRADLYVYLHRPIEVLLKHIAKRGRDFEKHIDREYLSMIQDSYFQFFKEQPDLPVLIIDAEDFDFENNIDTFMIINSLINRNYEAGISRIKLGDAIKDEKIAF